MSENGLHAFVGHHLRTGRALHRTLWKAALQCERYGWPEKTLEILMLAKEVTERDLVTVRAVLESEQAKAPAKAEP